ncbi:LytR/AlgR family response regulator transcription factor [Robertkochia aurantiaca]|uniref:LytR/AlgR family response regulator transcription factor n=1 Tax=Robertkochia aurantiaca TaxID=2873700 RepID=UPI001CCAB1A7|nr:LytTR family DNA-binding domain-containing protein [Robertkochia sp. 3YJGBD-33]
MNINNLQRFLNTDHPYYHQGKGLLLIGACLFAIGFLFEYFIVPFPRNPSEHLFEYWVICLVHVTVATLLYLIFFFLVNHLVNTQRWKRYKEFFSVVAVLFLIGFVNWLIRDVIYDNPYNHSLGILWEEVWHAFLSGGVILFLALNVYTHFLQRKHEKQAAHIHFNKTLSASDRSVKIEVDSDQQFYIDTGSFLCARSEGNYIEVFSSTSAETNRTVYRFTMNALEQRLKSYPGLFRSHRSYMVNIDKIQQVEGNAQGYMLQVENLDFPVPVSRGRIEAFRKLAD